MRVSRLHRLVGIVLILPFIGWVATGFIFFLKPGYSGAYEMPVIKTYALETPEKLDLAQGWQEIRYFRTILGNHLLVKSDNKWQQLDPYSKQPRPLPDSPQIKRLLLDALTTNPARYGHITSIDKSDAKTDTGVEINLDWNSMTLQQHGRDTTRIDWLYRIHYLQWTGNKTLDKVLGFTGLSLVMILTSLGVWLAIRAPSFRRNS